MLNLLIVMLIFGSKVTQTSLNFFNKKR